MNTLKIDIPKDYQIDTFDQTTGVIRFKKKPEDIKERIKSFEDALEYHGITKNEFINKFCGTPDEEAYRQLKLIISALNEGWEPDWTNSSEPKYYPWFKMGGSSAAGFAFYDCDFWDSYSYCGSRLCFKSRELAEYAGKQFVELYKVYFT